MVFAERGGVAVTNWGAEARVGAFVVAALAVFVAFMLALGDCSFSPGVRVYADFGYTGGLQVGAPVKISGVRIGRVVDLNLLTADISPPAARGSGLGRYPAPVVRVSLDIDSMRADLLKSDARVQVETQGVIGESYVEVIPGLASTPWPVETALRGVDAPHLQTMLLQASSLLEVVAGIVGEDDRAETKGGVASALTALLRTGNSILSERRHAIETSIDNIAASSGDVRRLSARLADILTDPAFVRGAHDAGTLATELRADLPAFMRSARLALERVQVLSARLDEATAGSGDDIENLLADMVATGQALHKAALGADRLLAKVERGEGTIGGFVQDPQIYDDLKFIFRDLKRNPWKLFWRE